MGSGMRQTIRSLMLAGGVAVGFIAGSTTANAMLIDFAGLADSVVPGEGSVEGTFQLVSAGVYLRYSSNVNAYLDKTSGGRLGGLGACNNLGGAGGVGDQCVPSSDDNVGIAANPGGGDPETVTLSFFDDALGTNAITVDFATGFFRDADHYLMGAAEQSLPGEPINPNLATLLSDNLLVAVNGGALNAASETSFGAESSTKHEDIFSITFGYGGDVARQFYLQNAFIDDPREFTPVPVPAALPLFGGGLALIGFLGWRRRRGVAA